MILTAIVIVGAVLVLAAAVHRLGLEGALGCFAFLMGLLPVRVALPFLIDVTPQRALVWTLAAFYLMQGGRQARKLPRRYALQGLIALQLVWYAVSTWNSVTPLVSLKSAFGQVVEYFPIYFVLAGSITSAATVDRILRGIAYAVLVCCCFGAVEAYTGWNVVDACFPHVAGNFDLNPYQDVQRGLRIAVTYPHPILYGTALAGAIPIALYLLSVARTRKERVVLWVGLALMALNLFKTSSRGPWAVGALAVLSFGLLCQAARVKRAVAVMAVLALLVCVARPGVWKTISDLLATTYDHNSPVAMSYEYRSHLWHESTAQLAAHPERALWGFGKASFFSLNLTSQWEDGKVRPLLSCDSAWIEILMDTGWIGLAITGALLLKPLRLLAALWRRAERTQRDRLLLLAVLLATYFLEMLSVAIYSSWCQNVYTLWILMAAAVSTVSLLQQKSKAPARPAVGARIIRVTMTQTAAGTMETVQ
ncbi:MAG: O-antigen ligase family protein [Acidobacteriota bacterium]|nr:O-antigen ligase family protein [Acidobacteriota bacterium]